MLKPIWLTTTTRPYTRPALVPTHSPFIRNNNCHPCSSNRHFLLMPLNLEIIRCHRLLPKACPPTRPCLLSMG